MQPAPSSQRQIGIEPVSSGSRPSIQLSSPTTKPAPGPSSGLSAWEVAIGFGVLLLWLLLFGGGIMVDTEPYRRLISPSGADALKTAAQSVASSPAQSVVLPQSLPNQIWAWFVVLSCFVPLNLAWLCVAASALGAVGSFANLNDDHVDIQSRDSSNPYLSALLRGFFVYLFMMSGLLLLDDAPFVNTGPVQYIRLAGFLSLFSFVVSYHPRLFSALLSAASQRIQVRGADGPQSLSSDTSAAHATIDIERGKVDVAMAKRSGESDGSREPAGGSRATG